jgi:hypothetical protein
MSFRKSVMRPAHNASTIRIFTLSRHWRRNCDFVWQDRRNLRLGVAWEN